jgi:hypothetical protein
MSKPIKDKQKDNGNKWSSSSSSSRFFKRNGLEALGGYPSSSILGPGTQRKDVFGNLDPLIILSHSL